MLELFKFRGSKLELELFFALAICMVQVTETSSMSQSLFAKALRKALFTSALSFLLFSNKLRVSIKLLIWLSDSDGRAWKFDKLIRPIRVGSVWFIVRFYKIRPANRKWRKRVCKILKLKFYFYSFQSSLKFKRISWLIEDIQFSVNC